MRSELRVALAALALAPCGCTPDFTPPSEIHGVRVLAVRQDPASGSPGVTVNLDMLVTPRNVSIGWLGGCNNPPSRQYYACTPQLRATSQLSVQQRSEGDLNGTDDANGGAGAEGGAANTPALPSFAVTLPEDVLSAAPDLASDPVHYGVSYVFFAACNGTLGLSGNDGFPFDCVDASGAAAGPSDFVIGFTTIYSYDGADNQNTNPVLSGLDFDGAPAHAASPFDANAALVPLPCHEDADCTNAPFSHSAVCSTNGLCAPLVSACEGKKCPAYSVLPHVDAASFETFTGEHEVMWASFYTNLGTFDSDTRLVNDRVNGATRDVASSWSAPAPDGSGARRTSTVWVTLNDQRGGATWASFDVVVQ